MKASLPELSPEAIEKARSFRQGIDPWPEAEEFSSVEAYVHFAEAISRLNHNLPLETLGSTGSRTTDRVGLRQVGPRLPSEDYDRLRKVATHYGVAPATMARIFVVRMVRGWT